MAAPSFVAASTGSTDAGGAWTATCHAPGAAGRLIILQVFQDGNTGNAVSFTSATNINNLAGTPNQWTGIDADAVASFGFTGQIFVWFGRSTGTSAPTFTGGNTTSEDLYWRFYEFSDVNTGSALSDIMENGSAGTFLEAHAASGSIADVEVTTLGPDRLAINLIGLVDDSTVAQFSGQTGGTWVEVAEYAEASGTDASIQLQWATMASAGTINGGTAAQSLNVPWGNVGFALIGTTVATKAILFSPHKKYLIRR